MRIDRSRGRGIRAGILVASLLSLAAIVAPAEARITSIEITSVQSPTFDGGRSARRANMRGSSGACVARSIRPTP